MPNITQLSLLIFLLVIVIACSPSVMEESFLPTYKNLQTGIAHKYYITNTPENKNDRSRTTIQYRYYKQNKAGIITEQRFSPSLRLTSERQYRLEGASVKMLYNKRIDYDDSTYYKITGDSIFIDFEGKAIHYQSETTYDNGAKQRFNRERTDVRDTLIDEKAAKIVSLKTKIYTTYTNGERDTFETIEAETYVQGLGLWEIRGTYKGFKRELILVEQIPNETFWEMQAHEVKRGGYIDFEKTLDKEEPFELCRAYHEINDYYNSTPHAGYIGGKKPLWKYINERLDSNELKEESGYLTFRFVINCKGTAGRFSIDQVDLDFREKTFSPATIEHCYQILKSIPEWQSITISEIPRDAYTYVTFKLKNGKIIELLP